MEKHIITISREFGSGGRTIGKLVVDRKNNLDSLQVQVEVRKDFFSDDMGRMLAMKKALSDKLKSVLSISAEVKLMEPNSIARSEGKSKRVIDNRILK